MKGEGNPRIAFGQVVIAGRIQRSDHYLTLRAAGRGARLIVDQGQQAKKAAAGQRFHDLFFAVDGLRHQDAAFDHQKDRVARFAFLDEDVAVVVAGQLEFGAQDVEFFVRQILKVGVLVQNVE